MEQEAGCKGDITPPWSKLFQCNETWLQTTHQQLYICVYWFTPYCFKSSSNTPGQSWKYRMDSRFYNAWWSKSNLCSLLHFSHFFRHMIATWLSTCRKFNKHTRSGVAKCIPTSALWKQSAFWTHSGLNDHYGWWDGKCTVCLWNGTWPQFLAHQ